MSDVAAEARREAQVERPGEVWVAETELRAGSIGLTGAVMQNITHIAPAIAALFFTPFIVSLSGAHSPLAYLIGVIVVAGLGICLVQLAKHLPSAGGYFTYVSRTVSPRAGFLTAWTFTFYSPLVTGPVCAYFGVILENSLQENYGFHFPWWAFAAIAIPAIAVLSYFGIKLSIRAIVILGSLEFLIVLALALSGLADPGPGGFTFRTFTYGFNPGDIATASGFALAVVFTVQALTGWEAAVPLAEETENPRRNISRATMLSIFAIGLLLILAIWGQVIGWGYTDLKSLVESPVLPGLELGKRVWGEAWPVVLFALFTSSIAVCLATQNVATRMWYGMGRAGALPKVVATLDPKTRTPVVAVFIQFLLALGLGLPAAAFVGPTTFFFLMQGLVLVLAVIFVYGMANLGVFLYYWRERRREFNWFVHALLPFATTGVLAYAVVKSFQPFPAAPYKWAPWIVGGWMLVGVGVLIYLHRTGREHWFAKAGEIVEERLETPEERARRHVV
jgi:amino acid transporter